MSDLSKTLPAEDVCTDNKVPDVKQLSSDEMFIHGKKLYIIGDYSKALEFLSKSCKMRESESGPLCDKMFESYFYLAKAYYMYSKYETELIGDGLEIAKEPNEETGDELNEIVETENEAKAADDEEKLVETNVDGSQSDKNDDDNEEDDAKDETKEASNEVLTYLQLSYETMECAKLILKRQKDEKKVEDSVIDLKMADCCDLVGSIYMEEGVINEAINQYNESLSLKKQHLGDDSRVVAESYYNLAVAHTLDYRNDEAIDNYEKCRSIMVVCKDKSDKQDELQELDEIIAEIDEKITDCREGDRDYKMAKESLKQFLIVPSSDLPVSDVAHLVRRKSDAGGEPAQKMRKLD